MSDENSENTETPEVEETKAAETEAVERKKRKENVNRVAIKKLADEVKAGDDGLNKLKLQNLDFILDIPLKVTVELGRSSMAIKDILQLGQGSVLELDKLAGEDLEILVNGKLIARGEVVVVNEKFGIRITNIISPIERIEKLKNVS